MRKLQESKQILFNIKAQKTKIKKVEGEYNPKAETDFTNLHENLWICKGSPVYLTVNLNPSIGLYNSSEGTVIDIIFHDDDISGEKLPKYVLVEFDEYKG